MIIAVQSIEKASPYLAEVKQLGKLHASTLGLFPEGAFDDHAEKKQILVAVDENGKLAGYLLYRVSNRRARIVHLCIDQAFREKGISRILVDRLKEDTADLIGISLKCRRDYAANDIWPRFGFVAQSEVVGRGERRMPLVCWWYDHDQPSLFDYLVDADTELKVTAVIDSNVFFDLHEPDRDGHEESKALLADWLSDLIDIRITDELLNEINQSDNAELRHSARARASHFPSFKHDKSRYKNIHKQIVDIHPKSRDSQTQRDKSDIKHLAMAIAGDLSYFITRDGIMLREDFCESIWDNFGLRVTRPSEFIRKIDELRSNQAYEPARLSGTELRFCKIRSGQESLLSETFHQAEPLNQFKKRLRGYAANMGQFACSTIESNSGDLLAFVVCACKADGRTEVPIFRVCRGKLAPTLTRHLIVNLANDSIRDGMHAIEFTDSFLDCLSREALVEESFIENPASFSKFHVAKIGPARSLVKSIDELDCRSDQESFLVSQIVNTLKSSIIPRRSDVCDAIEHILFPMKIANAPIETYIVPIRPNFAKELFDSDLAAQGLFPVREDLALRKEQVYYRSKLNSAGIRPPARILWYVSQNDALPHKTGAIRACSRLLEVMVDRPKPLFQKNKRLGIYSWEDVFDTAKRDLGNDIMALRFGSTELFSTQITYSELKELSQAHDFGLQLASISKIPQSVFTEIYSRGLNKATDEDDR